MYKYVYDTTYKKSRENFLMPAAVVHISIETERNIFIESLLFLLECACFSALEKYLRKSLNTRWMSGSVRCATTTETTLLHHCVYKHISDIICSSAVSRHSARKREEVVFDGRKHAAFHFDYVSTILRMPFI